MAARTKVVTLSTDAWTELSDGTKLTVLIECPSQNGCELALADSAADLTSLVAGHILALTGNGMAVPFFSVTSKVFARRLNGKSTTLVVTAY